MKKSCWSFVKAAKISNATFLEKTWKWSYFIANPIVTTASLSVMLTDTGTVQTSTLTNNSPANLYYVFILIIT